MANITFTYWRKLACIRDYWGAIKKASTILCSQFSPEGSYEKFESPQLADSILDRIIHDSFTVLFDGEISMRERHGLKERALMIPINVEIRLHRF